ncbi:hypothetical protein TW95_gp0529 [Pandoravirus inopinatum]|uniref:F-box domain-containing protein n=1 Tax=Pandoravirus inopinatum TaxID=1605721 RepID=A0A0B5IX20_9VIRU|nr:hypothetical protein TW95_gp0529 [Pandoravirus inopinatum]AJF97263.1 hypothetical protein [Pandoravirus inopinatum]
MTIEQDPGAMVGSVVSPHAPSNVCEDVTLADLPREVLLHIVQFIEHPSDLLATRMAARLFDMIDVARRAAEWATCPAHAGAVIRSRAPVTSSQSRCLCTRTTRVGPSWGLRSLGDVSTSCGSSTNLSRYSFLPSTKRPSLFRILWPCFC